MTRRPGLTGAETRMPGRISAPERIWVSACGVQPDAAGEQFPVRGFGARDEDPACLGLSWVGGAGATDWHAQIAWSDVGVTCDLASFFGDVNTRLVHLAKGRVA